MTRNRLESDFYLRLFPIGTRLSTYQKEVRRIQFERSRRPSFSLKREIQKWLSKFEQALKWKICYQ